MLSRLSFLFLSQLTLRVNMISTYAKKIIGLEKSIKPFIYRDKAGQSKVIIYKGYQPHYQWFLQNQSKFNDTTPIFSYDRCSVDVALEMAVRNTTKLSYISSRNYQTVKAVPRIALASPLTSQDSQKQQRAKDSQKQQRPKGLFSNSSVKRSQTVKKHVINTKMSARALDLLNNFDFVIENTFLDIHPLESYQKMCGYLMVRTDPLILQHFQGFKCSESSLFQSFLTLPILNELREKFMITDELKTSVLQRKHNVTVSNEMVSDYIEKWKSTVNVKTFQNAVSSFDQKEKFQWVLNHNLGEKITKKDMLNQRYRKFSYAIFY